MNYTLIFVNGPYITLHTHGFLFPLDEELKFGQSIILQDCYCRWSVHFSTFVPYMHTTLIISGAEGWKQLSKSTLWDTWKPVDWHNHA